MPATPTSTAALRSRFSSRNASEGQPFFHLAVDHRPAQELYDIVVDSGCLVNLAKDPEHAEVREKLAKRLDEYLKETGDPRSSGSVEMIRRIISEASGSPGTTMVLPDSPLPSVSSR